MIAEDYDLTDVIDMHIHTAPDIVPRKLDDIGAARAAAHRGMRAIVLKSHVTLTADRATVAQRVVPEIEVYGGLCLNSQIGGLNPAAVEAALQMGARFISMPTKSAANQIGSTGISLLDEEGTLLPNIYEVLNLIAEADAILATGHIALTEIRAVLAAALEQKVRKCLITHVDHPLISMSLNEQVEWARKGVLLERCYLATLLPSEGGFTIPEFAARIRRVGPEYSVISTDLGQENNPFPTEGLAMFLARLETEGFTRAELDRMTKVNPARLLGLD